MQRLLRSRFLVACVASTVTALVVASIAWAAQSPVDASGVVHACYNAETGDVRLNVTGTCPARGRSTPITWNVQGPPGQSVTPIFAKLVVDQYAPLGSNVPVIASSHMLSAVHVIQGGGNGYISITFDRDVSLCAITPSATDQLNSNGLAFVYIASGASVTIGYTGTPLELDVVVTCAS